MVAAKHSPATKSNDRLQLNGFMIHSQRATFLYAPGDKKWSITVSRRSFYVGQDLSWRIISAVRVPAPVLASSVRCEPTTNLDGTKKSVGDEQSREPPHAPTTPKSWNAESREPAPHSRVLRPVTNIETCAVDSIPWFAREWTRSTNRVWFLIGVIGAIRGQLSFYGR